MWVAAFRRGDRPESRRHHGVKRLGDRLRLCLSQQPHGPGPVGCGAGASSLNRLWPPGLSGHRRRMVWSPVTGASPDLPEPSRRRGSAEQNQGVAFGRLTHAVRGVSVYDVTHCRRSPSRSLGSRPCFRRIRGCRPVLVCRRPVVPSRASPGMGIPRSHASLTKGLITDYWRRPTSRSAGGRTCPSR